MVQNLGFWAAMAAVVVGSGVWGVLTIRRTGKEVRERGRQVRISGERMIYATMWSNPEYDRRWHERRQTDRRRSA